MIKMPHQSTSLLATSKRMDPQSGKLTRSLPQSLHSSSTPRPVVICGPSGVGKSTLIKRLQRHFAGNSNSSDGGDGGDEDGVGFSGVKGYVGDAKFGTIAGSKARAKVEEDDAAEKDKKSGVTDVTRAQPREVNGVHYISRSAKEMKKDVNEGIDGDSYRTSLKSIESIQNKNKICLLDISIQGVEALKNSPAASTLNPFYVFIAPPMPGPLELSLRALEKRLLERGTDSEEEIVKKLKDAKGELEYGLAKGNFDEVFVNDDLDQCLNEMVEKFELWFPKVLSCSDEIRSEGEIESDEESSAKGTYDDDGSTESAVIPPPIVDPLTFPQTESGINDLLSKIDEECFFKGPVQSELHYQASNVYIPAGKKVDLPLPPIDQEGSKVKWSVTLLDDHGDRVEVNFGMVMLVEGKEVVAIEMEQISSPIPPREASNNNEKHAKEEDTTASESTDGSANVGSRDRDRGKEPSVKGNFTLGDSAPVTIVLKFDNSSSWVTPKSVNYSFTIVPPLNDEVIDRSLRAKSVLPRLLEGKEMALEKKKQEKSRLEALTKIKSKMENQFCELTDQVSRQKIAIEEIKKKSEEADEEYKSKSSEIKDIRSKVKKEQAAIGDLDKDISDLKKKLEKLQIERRRREEEKQKMESLVAMISEERKELHTEIASKKETEKNKAKELEGLEKERRLMYDNLLDLEKKRKARVEGEKRYAKEAKFWAGVADAVKLRFID